MLRGDNERREEGGLELDFGVENQTSLPLEKYPSVSFSPYLSLFFGSVFLSKSMTKAIDSPTLPLTSN